MAKSEVFERLRRLGIAWPAESIEAVAYLPGGYANDNYRIRHQGQEYVLRLACARPAGTAERSVLERLGPPVTPRLIAWRDGDMLTELVPGTALHDASVASAELGHYVASLHTSLPPGLPRYPLDALVRAWLSDATRAGMDLPPPILESAARWRWRPRVVRTSHNDLNPHNVIVRPGRDAPWCTLDFELVGGNDPLFDLVTLSELLGLDAPASRAMLAAYVEVHPSRQLSRRWQAARRAFLLREYAWAMAELASGNERSEVRAQARWAGAAVLELLS